MAVNIAELVERARIAQKEFENFNQEQVDKIVKAIGKVVYDNAEELAKMAVEETRMGVLKDKIAKNKGKSKTIWNDLKNKKSVDIIDTDEAKGLVYVAKPVGIVGAVTPTTNPIVTPMCNAMFALKGRNAIIVAPHPRAVKCGIKVVAMINEAISKCGAPQNLIQIIPEPSIETTNELMKAVDVVVATGGMAMVKSSYSSGNPAFGVGAGNVQCIIDRGVDIKEVVPKIIAGRIFDNGIICSGEQSIIAPEEQYDEIINEFKHNGAFYIDQPEQKQAMRQALFVHGTINKDVVGQSVQDIAKLAGIEMPADTKVIVVEADGFGTEDVLCKEKMCPVMVALKYKTFEDAVLIAQANLDVEGRGHSCALHSNNKENIEFAGKALTVSRLVVNQPCSTSAGGSFSNGLAPTTTLGCGSWGNNSISENFTYKHLINVSRIANCLANPTIPTDEELWAD